MGQLHNLPLQSPCGVAAHPVSRGCLPLMSLLLRGKQTRCHGFTRMRTGMRGVSVATLLTIPVKKKKKKEKINGAAAAVGCSESAGSPERLWAA